MKKREKKKKPMVRQQVRCCILFSKNIDTVILYTAEIRRLKSEIAELRTRYSQLENTTVDLSHQVKKLISKNHFLVEVNEAFANENDELQDSVNRYATYRLPKSFRQQEPDDKPSKHLKIMKN